MTTAEDVTSVLSRMPRADQTHSRIDKCWHCDAARLIDRLAGELAEAKKQQAGMVVLLETSLSQLAARDAELKVATTALRLVVASRRSYTDKGELIVIARDALAKLTKKEA